MQPAPVQEMFDNKVKITSIPWLTWFQKLVSAFGVTQTLQISVPGGTRTLTIKDGIIVKVANP